MLLNFQRVANDSGTRENEPLLADDQLAESSAQAVDSELALSHKDGEDPGFQARAPPLGWTPVKSQDEASVQQEAGHLDSTSIQ